MTLGISDGKFIKIDGMTCSHENSNDNLVKAKWKCSMDSNCTGVLDQYCVDSRVTYHWQFCNDVPVPHGNTQVETGFIFGIPTQKDLSCVWKKIDRDRKFAYITALYNGILFLYECLFQRFLVLISFVHIHKFHLFHIGI